jgi:hypothetical protein
MAAGAAVVGGAASVGARRGAAKAQEQQAQQTQPQTQPPVGDGHQDGDDDRYTALRQLGELHDQGVLSDEEFAREKERLLGS